MFFLLSRFHLGCILIRDYALVFGGKKCGAFMSPLFRDSHPTCARCRGHRCFSDVTCNICKDWSVTQWEAFLKKRSYSGHRKSHPSLCVSAHSPPRFCFFGNWAPFTFSATFLPSFRGEWGCRDVGGRLLCCRLWCLLSPL